MSEFRTSHDELLQRSSNRYARAGQNIVTVLRRRLETPIAQASGQAIEDFMTVGCYVDNQLDNHALNRNSHEVAAEVALYLVGLGKRPPYISCKEQAKRLVAYISTHDQTGIEDLAKYFQQYIHIGDRIKQTSSPQLYAQLIRLEGRTIMRLLLSLLPENIRNNANNNSTFVWLQQLAQLGNVIDHFADARTDVTEKRVANIKVSHIRLSLACAALADFYPVIKELPQLGFETYIADALGVIKGTKK